MGLLEVTFLFVLMSAALSAGIEIVYSSVIQWMDAKFGYDCHIILMISSTVVGCLLSAIALIIIYMGVL